MILFFNRLSSYPSVLRLSAMHLLLVRWNGLLVFALRTQPWCLQDFGHGGKPFVMDDPMQGLIADGTLSDIGMAVLVGS